MGLKISDGFKGCGCTIFELNVSLQVLAQKLTPDLENSGEAGDVHKAREQEFVVVQPLGLMPADVATFDQNSYFSSRDPAKALRLRAPKAKVLWMGWLVDRWLVITRELRFPHFKLC